MPSFPINSNINTFNNDNNNDNNSNNNNNNNRTNNSNTHSNQSTPTINPYAQFIANMSPNNNNNADRQIPSILETFRNGPDLQIVVCQIPINSSGDVYHLAALFALCHQQECAKLKAQYLYAGTETSEKKDKLNSITQAKRSQQFLENLGFGSFLMSNPISLTDKWQPNEFDNLLRKKLAADAKEKTEGLLHLDAKLVTMLLRVHCSRYGFKRVTGTIRKRWWEGLLAACFSSSERFVQNYENVLPWIKNELNKLHKWLLTTNEKAVTIFHIRKSKFANAFQNIEDGAFWIKLGCFFNTKYGGTSFFIICDDEPNAMPEIDLEKRSDPMIADPNVGVVDSGKMKHLGLLICLLNRKHCKLLGVVGNTSGNLDAAAFVGHRVLNYHNIKNGIDYQCLRIFSQSVFMSIEFIPTEDLVSIIQNEFKEAHIHMPSTLSFLLRKSWKSRTVLKEHIHRSLCMVVRALNDRKLQELFGISVYTPDSSRKVHGFTVGVSESKSVDLPLINIAEENVRNLIEHTTVNKVTHHNEIVLCVNCGEKVLAECAASSGFDSCKECKENIMCGICAINSRCKCRATVCPDCIQHCFDCETNLCDACSIICSDPNCGQTMCRKHGIKCKGKGCNTWVCSMDHEILRRCKICKMLFCDDCAEWEEVEDRVEFDPRKYRICTPCYDEAIRDVRQDRIAEYKASLRSAINEGEENEENEDNDENDENEENKSESDNESDNEWEYLPPELLNDDIVLYYDTDWGGLTDRPPTPEVNSAENSDDEYY